MIVCFLFCRRLQERSGDEVGCHSRRGHHRQFFLRSSTGRTRKRQVSECPFVRPVVSSSFPCCFFFFSSSITHTLLAAERHICSTLGTNYVVKSKIRRASLPSDSSHFPYPKHLSLSLLSPLLSRPLARWVSWRGGGELAEVGRTRLSVFLQVTVPPTESAPERLMEGVSSFTSADLN